MTCYLFLIVCPSTIFILCIVINLHTTNDIRYINTFSLQMCKNTVSFFKKMVLNRYANNVLRIFNCMPQHYIHTMYCNKNLHYTFYTIWYYILFITTLPYRITTKHVITLIVNCPNTKNETVCKFRSNIKGRCILNTMQICFKTT